MSESSVDILGALAGKWSDGTRPADLFARHVAVEPETHLPRILEGYGEATGKVRSGCAELLSLLSESRPDLVWPHRAVFEANVTADAPVVRWEAVCTLGNLAAADPGGELATHIPAIAACLDHTSIVLQGHAVRALAKMARAYPAEAPWILSRLVASPERFPGSRVGFLVEAMAAFDAPPELRASARAFAGAYVDSDIKAVAQKARRTLRRLDAT